MAVIGQAEILLTANTASFTTEMDRARSVSQRTARQIERDQQQQAQARLQIERQYADEHRRIEMALTDEVARIRAARFNNADEQRYIAQARANAQAQVDAIAEQERATTGFADKAKTAYGYVAIAVGAAGVAIGALIKNQIEMTAELTKTAYIANTTVENIQKYVVAAKGMGIETDKLGDIFKDTQDKVGDFLTTGGGEMKDFFDNIAPQVKVTADQFRNLSGPDALQLYFDSLQKANLSQSEMIFYMEAVADEASALIPYLKDGGKGFDLWAQAAENAGATMDEKTIRATQELKTSTELLNLSVQGAKNQIAVAFMPVLRDLAVELVKDAQFKEQAAKAGQGMADGFKLIANTGIAAVSIIGIMSDGVRGLHTAFSEFGKITEGVDFTSPFATLQLAKNAFFTPVRIGADVAFTAVQIQQRIDATNSLMDKINKLGTNPTGSNLVSTLTNLNIQSDKLKNATGKTGKALKDEAEAKKANAKETERLAKANAMVSNTALAGLKIKSNEATAGGKIRQATADFAQLGQSLIGGNLKYFSAFNDRYHLGKSSDHNKGMAFDIVLKDARQARAAVNELNQAAQQYGYTIKTIDEYANPSARATGGHIHVSVKGYRNGKDGTADVDYIKQQNQQSLQAAKTQAAEAQRLAEQQAREAERAAKEQKDLQLKYVTQFADEKTRLYIEHTNTEAEIAKINDAKLREQLLKTEDVRYQNKLDLLQLESDKQIQKATEWQQSDEERIRATAELERREAALTLTNDAKLRQAKIDAINAQEQESLRQLRAGFESELAGITDYSKSELQRLRDDYQNNLRGIDSNSKYSDAQKSDLRNALAGKFNSDLAILRRPAADAFNGLNAEMSGTSELMNLQNQLNQRLEIINKAKAAEVIATEQAEKAKARVERQYQISRYDMMMSSGQQILGSVTSSLKATLGEHNRAYRVMFAVERGVNIARSLMAINTGIAMAAANPFPMNLGAMVSVAAATASIVSDLMAIKNPVGQAHDGIMSVPESGTWNLQKGERVLPEYTAKRLDKTLDKVNTKSGGGDIIINNYSSNTVTARRDGNLTIIDVRNEIDTYVPEQLSRTNTPISQALRNNTTAQRRV